MTGSFTNVSLELPNGQDTVEKLLQVREVLDDNRRRLQAQMATADQQVKNIDLIIQSINLQPNKEGNEATRTADEANESSTEELPKTEGPSDDAEPVSGVATVADIAHCKNQRAASYIIAKMNGGVIDLKTAAVVIEAAGLSKGKRSTIVSTLHSFMTKAADWDYAKPSTFKLVTGRGSVSEVGSMTDSSDGDSPEGNAVEGVTARMMEETAA